MINLDNTIIDIMCPKCKFVNQITLGDVKVGKSIVCRGCEENIRLVDKDASIANAERNINKSINDLRKVIKKTKLTVKI